MRLRRCQRRRRHDETIVVPRAFEAHLLERGTDNFEVGPAGAGHLDRATRDCGNDSPTSGLDVVAIEPVRRRLESDGGFDTNGRRAFALDRYAQPAQKPAKLGDVRFRRRVPDFSSPLRGGGRQQRRFGAGHRRLVEVERCAVEPRWGFERVARLVERHGPHRRERLKVCGNRSPRGKITAGRREASRTPAREQRTEQQDRTAQSPDQCRIGTIARDRLAPDVERRGATAVNRGAQAQQQVDQHFHVPDPRDVRQHAFLIGQETRGEQRQRRILVALDRDAPFQPSPSLNPECGHLGSPDRRLRSPDTRFPPAT